jgi:MFS family permease
MTFNWKRALSVGFGFVAIFLIWPTYNQFIPIFLQVGNPLWQAESTIANPSLAETAGFGLSPTLAFFIMTWDNIINIFVQSWAGAKSDRTQTRWGRRKPWLLLGVPIAALGFILIPFAAALLALLLFLVITNTGMALFRAPTAALLGDLFPPQQRSKARGIMAMMAVGSGVLALIAGSVLFERIGRPAPFIFCAILMITAAVIVMFIVREPPLAESQVTQSSGTVRQALRALWQTEKRSGFWLFLTIALSFMVIETLQAGLSSFAVFVLGLPLAQAVRYGAILALVLVLSAYPSGLIATRFGRQQTINAGLIGLLITAVGCYLFVRTPTSFALNLVPLGFFLSLIVINDLPLLYDIGDESQIGAYTGVYFVATQSAAVLGPTLAGFAVEIVGSHRAIFAFAALCAILAWTLLQRVQLPRPQPEAASEAI